MCIHALNVYVGMNIPMYDYTCTVRVGGQATPSAFYPLSFLGARDSTTYRLKPL